MVWVGGRCLGTLKKISLYDTENVRGNGIASGYEGTPKPIILHEMSV
jgi:hypothetical protein